jgi:hypothetical protein
VDPVPIIWVAAEDTIRFPVADAATDLPGRRAETVCSTAALGETSYRVASPATFAC